MNRLIIALMVLPFLGACGRHDAGHADEHDTAAHDAHEAEDFERGPHGGRLLSDGDFAIEMTIFETNTPPQFRLYAYRDGEVLDPAGVQATVTLHRLDGEENRFAFEAREGFLRADGVVEEPHSFDVTVTASHGGSDHRWTYATYEGRTTIPADVAQEAGIEVESAGPARIRDTIHLLGVVTIDANRQAVVKARFPGSVREVLVEEGQHVSRGQTLLVVEGNDSMRTYPVVAPIDGVVLARHTNVGDVAGDNALIELADLSRVWVDLRALGTDAERLRAGQPVEIRAATGSARGTATIQRLLPLAAAGQGTTARVSLPNAEGTWRPGMTVSAEVTTASREVPLAVKESALQGFRDFTVVFARVDDTYEVRMLELGARDGLYAEVLGGLKPGTMYVTAQSFLIRADIEKSGASHDH